MTSPKISLPVVLIFLLCNSGKLFAQHDSTKHKMPIDMNMVMPMEPMDDTMQMSSSFSPNLSMSRDGSGTSWQPDDSPEMMYMKMKGKTNYMFHGFVFFRYHMEDLTNANSRAADKLDAPNMLMFMMNHQFNEKNLFSFGAMFSLDPLTVGEAGYPLLFQTGESYKGVPLVDRQHPHDLFSALAVNYTHSFSKDVDLNTYFGYPGEPALGPVVFMHRISSMNNPNAPLGHHWQDATHISFGVGTLGLRYKKVKLEGSIFTGREPDEERYNFDKAKFDSYSGRLSYNPDEKLSIQVSSGFIKSPEALSPGEDVVRTTASITHTNQTRRQRFISTTLVWGMNHNSDGTDTHSILAETNLNIKPAAVYLRYEYVQKSAHELNLHQFGPPTIFNIQALTIGLNKALFTFCKTAVSMGLQGTLNFPDKVLKPIYGRLPFSAAAYLKVAPAMSHEKH